MDRSGLLGGQDHHRSGDPGPPQYMRGPVQLLSVGDQVRGHVQTGRRTRVPIR